jgi:hypothetical protein
VATSLEVFLPLVRGRLPGCPDMILTDAVRDACIEFCKRTRLLTEDVAIDVVQGERTVELLPDTDTAWEVLKVWRTDGDVLTASNRQDIADSDYDIDRAPRVGTTWKATACWCWGPTPMPTRRSPPGSPCGPRTPPPAWHDVLWQDYRQPICAGARAWVRRHYGEWINDKQEAEDRSVFELGVHQANLRRARGGANAQLRVRAHPF